MSVNGGNFNECILSWFELKECWATNFDQKHARSIFSLYRLGRVQSRLVPMIQMHGGPITEIKQNGRREPLKGLASISFVAPLGIIKCMGNRDGIHGKYQVVNCFGCE